MKKILLAVTAALAITGCSQNEEFDNVAQNAEISFNTNVSKSTRAILTENQNFEKFIAYGYAHVGDADKVFDGTITSVVMTGATYEKNGSAWATTGSYYWPTSGKVSFFGYAGVTAATYDKQDGAFPTLTYTTLEGIDKLEDLVVAQTANQSKPSNNAAINLNFKHALTQVYFKLKGNDANLTYTVKKIELLKVKTKGTFTYGNAPETSIGTWEIDAASSTQDYVITLADPGQSVTGDAPATSLNDASSQIMILMPQELKDVQVKVTYSAKTKEGVEVHSINEPVTVNLSGTWTAGSKIAYVLSLNGDVVNLTGSADDTSWTEKTDENTEINK